MNLASSLGRFRLVSLLEGVSYLLLMGVAMPLKYLAGHPEAVTWSGRVHGGLFVAFVVALALAARDEKWPQRATGTAMIASLIPLGAFWLEHRLRRARFPT